MQVDTLLDKSTEETKLLFSSNPTKDNKLNLSLGKLRDIVRPISEQSVLDQATHQGYTVQELESGSIQVLQNNKPILPAKPTLRSLSTALGLSLLNSNGNPMNTRQLGSLLIKQLKESEQR